MSAILAQTEGGGTVLFYLLALLAAASAAGVVVSRNIVRMAVFLMFTLAAMAGLYFLLEAEFLAAVQLVVYAGGTLILIVFGVMLTSKSPSAHFEARGAEIVVALVIGAVMLAALVVGLLAAQHGGAFAGQPLPSGQPYPMRQFGQALLGDYLIPFEVASVLLLVVMIGAAYLAKARRKDEVGGGPSTPDSKTAARDLPKEDRLHSGQTTGMDH